jgi:hypothetical protein
MRRFPFGAEAFEAIVATALCVVVTTAASALSTGDVWPGPLVEKDARSVASASANAVTIPSQPSLAEDARIHVVQDDDPADVIVYQPERSRDLEYSSSLDVTVLDFDRAYLVETATPGQTMTRQGPELAIGRLHPEFVHRLAGAIREARQAGLSSVGVFSAYRPPALGVGGFSDKFNSLHTYGLAVDMTGIGGPGSADAKLWYEIAARHGVVCPYGFANRVEWNHCQPTRLKIIVSQNPLRETVTADGPIDLGTMFQTGNSYIQSSEEVLADSLLSNWLEGSAYAERGENDQRTLSENGNIGAGLRIAKIGHFLNRVRTETLRDHPSWCRHLHHPGIKSCDTDTATKIQGTHPKQASTGVPRHHT